MRDTQHIDNSMIRRTVLTLATLVVALSMTACSHAMMMIHGTGAKRPAASEFGLGPRPSAGGRYVATLEPGTPLRPREMQTVRVVVRDADGARSTRHRSRLTGACHSTVMGCRRGHA